MAAEQAAAAEAERQRQEAEEAERLRAEADEAERAEAQRLVAEQAAVQEAERVATERAEQERAEAERLEGEAAERAEVQRLADERAEAERVDASAEPAAAEEPHAVPSEESDALEQARDSVEQASGRREVRDATEALVDELRGRYEADPDAYLRDYLEALDQLATARWQAGDWWGSRTPSKEAKALRKQHGL